MNQPSQPPTPLLLDMVHHNPGEAPFATRFDDPRVLAALGYTGQVRKHLSVAVDFEGIAPGLFPATSEERAWLAAFAAERDAEIAAARRAGIAIFFHVDLFVLPRRVIEAHRGAICDARGRIDLTRPATLDLHRRLLAAMFARFPDVDGLVIRVGETYLFDSPFHDGNTAVPLHDPAVGRNEQIRQFRSLISFLREEICVRHERTLIHRTWDYFGDRFHAAPDFYLAVTDAIEPHPRMVFFIKHVAGDFFRGCRPNPCLGLGRHRQIVEVQCQREYEGKGAFPNYVARGVIEGFPEVPGAVGLREWRESPNWAGLWTWSRGGGWFGPYLANEFWPDFNVRVLAEWMQCPERPEAALFRTVCRRDLGMDDASVKAFREMCLLSEEAIWLGRSSAALAEATEFREADVARLWMRDDCLGGMEQLAGIFADLERFGRLEASVREKQRAAECFGRMVEISQRVWLGDARATAALRASADYGARLFAIVADGWALFSREWRRGRGESIARVTAGERSRHAALWEHYRALPNAHPTAASLFRPVYWNWPGHEPTPGWAASIEQIPVDLEEG